jgi:hypothetical protein
MKTELKILISIGECHETEICEREGAWLPCCAIKCACNSAAGDAPALKASRPAAASREALRCLGRLVSHSKTPCASRVSSGAAPERGCRHRHPRCVGCLSCGLLRAVLRARTGVRKATCA